MRLPADLLRQLADRQRRRILQRTAAGLDLYGYRFRPYQPAYRQHRAAAGHTTTPNLFRTGDMLGGITTRLTNRGVALTFTTAHQHQKAAANHQHRPFFGISPDDRHAILQDLKAFLQSSY